MAGCLSALYDPQTRVPTNVFFDENKEHFDGSDSLPAPITFQNSIIERKATVSRIAKRMRGLSLKSDGVILRPSCESLRRTFGNGSQPCTLLYTLM